jgi:exosortase/archaeosortase family protein
MLALFLGEMYRLRYWGRLALVPASLLIAFVANVGRTSFLTWSAARLGMARMESLHDLAGLAVVVIVFGLLWLAARLLAREANQKVESRKQKWEQEDGPLTTDYGLQTTDYRPLTTDAPSTDAPPTDPPATDFILHPSSFIPTAAPLNSQLSTLNSPPPTTGERPQTTDLPSLTLNSQLSTLNSYLLASLAWLLCIEGAAVVWFHLGDKRAVTNPAWSINWPTRAPGYREEPLSKVASDMLRYDTAKSVAWQDEAGNRWGFMALRWGLDNKNSFIARGHTPDLCFTGAGWKLVSEPAPVRVAVNGIELPFRRYIFEAGGVTEYAFLTLWDERSPGGRQETPFAYGIARRLKAAAQGKRHQGLKKLEISVVGPASAEEALGLLRQKLGEMIVVEKRVGR